MILCLETATKNCSVSLYEGTACLLTLEESGDRFVHGERLHLLIEEALALQGKKVKDLDGVVIGRGPGSYTGLRIGTSAAKGIAYALGVPMYAVPTLGCFDFSEVHTDYAITVLDARRDEVYAQLWQQLDGLWTAKGEVYSEIVGPESWAELAKESTITILGDCTEKVARLLEDADGFSYQDEVLPSAKYMGTLLPEALEQPVDTAYFEPFYLKDFVAVKSTKKLL